MALAKSWSVPVYEAPWFMLPLVTQWRREDGRLVAEKVERFRVDVQGTYQLGNLPIPVIEAMVDTERAMREARGGEVDAPS